MSVGPSSSLSEMFLPANNSRKLIGFTSGMVGGSLSGTGARGAAVVDVVLGVVLGVAVAADLVKLGPGAALGAIAAKTEVPPRRRSASVMPFCWRYSLKLTDPALLSSSFMSTGAPTAAGAAGAGVAATGSAVAGTAAAGTAATGRDAIGTGAAGTATGTGTGGLSVSFSAGGKRMELRMVSGATGCFSCG